MQHLLNQSPLSRFKKKKIETIYDDERISLVVELLWNIAYMPSRCLVVYRSIDDAGDGATAITLSKRNHRWRSLFQPLSRAHQGF